MQLKISRLKGLQEALQAPPRDKKEAALLDGLKAILGLSEARSRLYGFDQYGVIAQEAINKWNKL